MRSIELSGGSVLEGTASGCDAVDVGWCCQSEPRFLGTPRDYVQVRSLYDDVGEAARNISRELGASGWPVYTVDVEPAAGA